MGEIRKYYAGIDPGQTGGIGIIDNVGSYVAAHRWDKRDPVRLYNILLLIKEDVDIVYIELVNAHPGEGVGHVTQTQSLMVNLGIWQGWLMAAGLSYILIHPATWQSVFGLRSWQVRRKLDPAAPSPLSLARSRWLGAPLDYQADDGKAVGLLLADLARRDHLAGIDRGALQARAAEKSQIKKRKIRQARKLAPGLRPDRP